MKQTIRLSENELHRLIKESVKRVLNENRYVWLGEYNFSNIQYLIQNAEKELQNGQMEVSFNLNGMDFTIERDDKYFYFSSGQYQQGGKGRSFSLKDAVKHCWGMANYNKQQNKIDEVINKVLKRTILNEEADTGQVMSAQEREELRNQRLDRDKATEDVRRKINSIRRRMVNASPEESEKLRQEIIKLKKQANF